MAVCRVWGQLGESHGGKGGCAETAEKERQRYRERDKNKWTDGCTVNSS